MQCCLNQGSLKQLQFLPRDIHIKGHGPSLSAIGNMLVQLCQFTSELQAIGLGVLRHPQLAGKHCVTHLTAAFHASRRAAPVTDMVRPVYQSTAPHCRVN